MIETKNRENNFWRPLDEKKLSQQGYKNRTLFFVDSLFFCLFTAVDETSRDFMMEVTQAKRSWIGEKGNFV